MLRRWQAQAIDLHKLKLGKLASLAAEAGKHSNLSGGA